MRKIDFNQDWYFKRLEQDGKGTAVNVPHDAMCLEERNMESKGCHNIGWFEGHDYIYQKEFWIPKAYKGKKVLLEFEGVYHNAEVYVNEEKVAFRPYGYTNFFVDISERLKYDENNTISVIAKNADQPNSRWYTGAGIYRPVWMYLGDSVHILENGVKIRTAECASVEKKARLEIAITTSVPEKVEIEILNEAGISVYKVCGESKKCGENAEINLSVPIENVVLWNCENPYLYTCNVRCGEDVVKEHFGIRKLEWNAQNGLTINGERVILKGACIHHDNGVLGACAFPEAEERKIRLLQELGYNAIRSAHNPCSKAMLDACDRLGMLVMDEYVDMWYIHKNRYDYASDMENWWKQDLKDMVEKDYNHPCVILYSTGNEVAETGEKKGIALTKEMTDYLHSLDATRPVSCGVNIFFNFLYSMGFGVYSDEKAEKQSSDNHKKATVGSEFYNTLAGVLGDKTMKIGATLPMCDVKTRDSYANMDIAGYNYGIYRYKHDLKKYPERLILGSETFCKDAYAFYELAKKELRIIGDFVWAGMDYIGEAGIGAWEYEDYAPKSGEKCGWLTAGSGRLDILGFEKGEAAYTKVALEKEIGPYIAVKPVYQKGKHSPSAWKMTEAMESWSWQGCEGIKATVEVYARATAIKLLLNGRPVGYKTMKKACNVRFVIPYESGELVAIAYNKTGEEIGHTGLLTAGENTKLSLIPEQETVKANGLSYIRIRYTDESGIWKPMEKHSIKIVVENGELLGFGNACSYNEDGYWKDTTKTYYGEALAVVRAGEQGIIGVSVSDEIGTSCVKIPIEG